MIELINDNGWLNEENEEIWENLLECLKLKLNY